MREITQILELLDKKFTTNELVKLHLMVGELESAMTKKVYSSYHENMNIKDIMINYTRIKQAVDGVWNGQVDIMNFYHSLMHQIKGIKETVNPIKVLEMVQMGTQELRLEGFMPDLATKGFVKDLNNFNEAYEEMMNLSHTDKLKILKEFIKIPEEYLTDKNTFIQESTDTKWNTAVVVTVSTRKKDKVFAKVFYLENWEVMSSKHTTTKTELLNATFTQDKIRASYFWPEEFL